LKFWKTRNPKIENSGSGKKILDPEFPKKLAKRQSIKFQKNSK
jgi:hypothetical protein